MAKSNLTEWSVASVGRLVGVLCLAVAAADLSFSDAPGADQPLKPKLLIAFASTRERCAPPYPMVYFYEHDGVASGKLLGAIDSITKGTNFTRADSHPSLSRDGRDCAFAAQFGVQDGGRVEVWDRDEKKLLPYPNLNESTEVHQVTPSLSADGKWLAFMRVGQAG